MGDMKTPDFDDLLAAFDIPDIDAKEAIQSSPDEERDGANADERETGSPPCFPAASHSDPPVVSVIVKNTVRSESLEEAEKSIRNKTDNPGQSSGATSQVQVKYGDLVSQLGSKIPANASVEPQFSNGFEGSASSDRGRPSAEPWPQHSPLRSTLKDEEADDHKAAEAGSAQLAPDIMSSLKPLPYLQSTTIAGPNTSNPASPQPASPKPPPLPHSPQDEDMSVPSTPLSPLAQNGSVKAALKRAMHSDDEDSEPDLGGPLVIQESPESAMSSPPKFKHRKLRRPELLGPPDTSAYLSSLEPVKPKPQPEEQDQLSTPHSPPAAPQPKSPVDCPPPSSVLVQKEIYPEHVIDERESPRSPPLSERGIIVPERSSSPDPLQIPTPAASQEDSAHQEEPMEAEPREDRPDDAEELCDAVTGAGENVTEESGDAAADDPAAAGETAAPAVPPIKVKIKMRTGSGARTVSGVTPKRNGKPNSRGVGNSKPPLERQSTKSKREQPQMPTMGKLQEGASTAKDHKPKVSPTAVSITKTAALPSVSVSFPRVSPGGVSPRDGPAAKNGAATLPTASPLLQPQSGSRPASIVNSTGAIISKSQTNLVEAFNKILNNKNLLPSYKPDLSSPLPAEWGLPLPAQGYRCLECGDAFALEQSLVRHYARRSLRIEVTCNHCAKRLAFFNKCSLLLHAREHKERGLIMQCSHLVMKPVPMEQMIIQQDAAAVGQAATNAAAQQHKAASNKAGEAVHYVNNKCPECQTQFSSKEEVAEHFQEVKAAHTTSCSECSPPMLLSNSCAAAAHQRTHQGCPPHVCPECGGASEQPAFQAHLDQTCLHFARRIGYRCSSCLVVFGGLNSVKSHIQQAHCDMFHKCPSCPMAFKSGPSIQNHINAQHPTLTDGQTMAIYKCVMCDTVFTNKALLHVHFDTHLTNQKVHVFKCPECTKLFSQRNSLLDHFKSHKAAALKQELPSPPAASSRCRAAQPLESSEGEDGLKEDKEEKEKAERMKTPTGWKCAPCHARYADREDYIAHMADQHGKTLKKFPCNKCESSFTTTSSLRRHIRDKHKVLNRGFRCQLCSGSKKTFSSRAMLEKHVQLRHSMSAEGQSTAMGGGEEADSSSEQDSALVARRRRRGAVKTEQQLEDESPESSFSPGKKSLPSSSSSSSAPAPYALPESGFRCAPCGFTTEEQASFLEHIGQHRRSGPEGASHQCLQCGACFTSASSLLRHRFISHKVRNALTESQQSPGAASTAAAASPAAARNHDDAKSSVDGSEAAASPAAPAGDEEAPHACKVCRRRFEKASDLNTHFRTHGMAFINARNAGKST